MFHVPEVIVKVSNRVVAMADIPVFRFLLHKHPGRIDKTVLNGSLQLGIFCCGRYCVMWRNLVGP
jgi:hypothetical protein